MSNNKELRHAFRIGQMPRGRSRGGWIATEGAMETLLGPPKCLRLGLSLSQPLTPQRAATCWRLAEAAQGASACESRDAPSPRSSAHPAATPTWTQSLEKSRDRGSPRGQ